MGPTVATDFISVGEFGKSENKHFSKKMPQTKSHDIRKIVYKL